MMRARRFTFDKITALYIEAVQIILGSEFAHLSINTSGGDESMSVVNNYLDASVFVPRQAAARTSLALRSE
jgi:hypothetical protein